MWEGAWDVRARVENLKTLYDLSATSYSGNCSLLAVLLAFPNGLGLCALLTGFVWMCTRATPALLLVSVSIAADVVASTNDVFWIAGWFVYSAIVGGVFVFLTRSAASEDDDEEALLGGKSSAKPKTREYV
ncbi:hypothetical protein T484DRAFT_1786392 [Baffinella frigidus]|nr:hypothetical protein T484DRAFT_1786392 [Cryptophyta sp. CCMP2293]